MRFVWGDQPPLLTVAAGVCLIVFIVSFCSAFYATFLILREAMADRADERPSSLPPAKLPRRMSRWLEFLVADEYKSLRRLYVSGWAGALGSMGLFALLMFLFGKPA
jgi:hypothetical protein